MNTQRTYTLRECANALGEVYLTASVQTGDCDPISAAAEIYHQVAEYLASRHLVVVQERVFGTLEIYSRFMQARKAGLGAACAPTDQPVTYIQGQPVWGKGLAGIQLQTVPWPAAKERVWTLYDEEKPCGRGWTRNGTTFLFLQNICPWRLGPGVDRPAQTEQMFERADRILQQNGASYRQVVRTWIYLSEILDWYAAFNDVRNAKYQKWGLMPDLGQKAGAGALRLPASTGIRGENLPGAACLMDLLAVCGTAGSRVEVTQLSNARQQDAFLYHRAFSRGVRIAEPAGATIHVSGTAAIDERGQSLYPDDMAAQVHRTLDNIEGLIAPFGARLQDTCSATVFVKGPEHFTAYQKAAAERGLREVPLVIVMADVCRPELLFEIDAVLALSTPARIAV